MIAAVEEVLRRAGAGARRGRVLRPRDDGRHQRPARGTRRPHGADRHPRASPTCSRSAARTGPTSTASAPRSRRRWSSRALRFEAAERVGPEGVVEPLAEDEPERLARAWFASAAPSRSRSACSSPTSTPRTSGASPSACAGELPGVHVSASHEVLPRFREYERCSTTAIDAYLSPLLGRYLGRLGEAAGAAGLPQPLVMQSSGGVAPRRGGGAGRAPGASSPGRPAAPSAPACSPASRGDGNALGFDMGGTSCDVCVVEDGEVRRTDSRRIGGRAIQLPMVDVHTVGAGGGSIGWRDPGGALRVGPRSAGADPGPACYGRGGAEPTVTDANLLLGSLAADSRLAGGVALDADAARAAVARARRARSASTSWRPPRGSSASPTRRWCGRCAWSRSSAGVDPRRFALLPFGGAGPMHAAAIAAELGIEPHPLPAGRRRPLGARALRLGSPPRHGPHRDAERRRS